MQANPKLAIAHTFVCYSALTDTRHPNAPYKFVKRISKTLLSPPAVLLLGVISFNQAWAATCLVNVSVSTPCTDLVINMTVQDIVINGSVSTGIDNRAVKFFATQNSFTNNSAIYGTDTGIQNFGGTTTTLTNNGSLVGRAFGLRNNDTLGTVNNTAGGSIQGLFFHGINNSGAISTLINTGTIRPGAYVTESLYNGGTIGTLVNAQGVGNGAGALKYGGILPSHYDILFSSASQYGQLFATSVSGSTFFGIGAGSVVSTTIYSNVLSGVDVSNISGGTTGTYGGYAYVLSLQSGSTTNWDLLFPSFVFTTDINTASNTLSAVGNTLNPVFNGGTLILNDGDSSGIDFAVNGSGGTLNTATGNATMSGVFSGGGDLSFTGAGSTTLSGSNTYTGDTVIAGGNLVIANDSNLGNAASNVQLNGGSLRTTADITSARTFTLNAPSTISTDANTTFTSTGQFIGNSTLIKSAAGVLALVGTNTYMGGTIINAGALQLGNGGTSGSVLGNVVNNATLAFNRSDNVTFSNVISGTGSVMQLGSGTTNLTGVNTYSGNTLISAGALAVNGSIANSATYIGIDGTLKGSGFVGDVYFNGAGHIAPGNSIGTLQVNSIDFTNGGVYEVEVNAAGNSDKLQVSDAAVLTDGKIAVLPAPGQYAFRTNYTILNAQSLVGSFAGVTVASDFAFLDADLSYDANSVMLSLQRNDSAFETAAQTQNQRAVGIALTNIAQSNAQTLAPLFDQLTVLSAKQSRDAFDSLSGVQHANSMTIALNHQQRFINLLSNRSAQLMPGSAQASASNSNVAGRKLAQHGDGNNSSVLFANSDYTLANSGWWLTPQYSRGEINSDANARGTDYRYSGMAAGVDRWVNDALLVGAALNYGQTNADDIRFKSHDVAFYGRWLGQDAMYLDAIATLGRSQADTDRELQLGASVARAEGDYHLTQRSVALELGKRFSMTKSFSISPFFGVHYTHLSRERITEKSNSATALKVSAEQQESLRSQLGVRIAKTLTTASGMQWMADAQAGWIHEFADNQSHVTAIFAGMPASQLAPAHFTVAGPALTRDRALLGVGISSLLNARASVRIGYEAEHGSTDGYYNAFASFKYMF